MLAARWSEASITMLTPTGAAALLTHMLPGAPAPVVRSRVGTCARMVSCPVHHMVSCASFGVLCIPPDWYLELHGRLLSLP